jgi:hypothetical protein
MNQHIDDEYFDGLRDEGLLLVDHLARKVGVVASRLGGILLITQEDGSSMVTTLNPQEIDSICAAMQLHKRKAISIGNSLEAEYETFTAIQRAIGL